MKRIERVVIIFIISFLLFISNIYASSGALRKASIKTCPNGKTYGYHGSDKHWHEAIPSNTSSGWSAVGEAFYTDPCPNNVIIDVPKDNESKQNNAGIEDKNNINNNEETKNTKIIEDNKSNTKVEEKPIIQKSNNTKISYLKINGEQIDIKDNIYYETDKDNVTIVLELEDKNASYEIIGNTSNFSNNNINNIIIKVVAEDNTIKNYYLEIKRIDNNKENSNILVNNNDNNIESNNNNESNNNVLSTIIGLVTLSGGIVGYKYIKNKKIG